MRVGSEWVELGNEDGTGVYSKAPDDLLKLFG